MNDPITLARQAARDLRKSAGYAALQAEERRALDHDLQRVEQALIGSTDPYAPRPMARAMAPTVDELQRAQSGGSSNVSGGNAGRSNAQPSNAPQGGDKPPVAPARAGTEVIGERTRNALQSVDFPSFVAGLINGTFQAIVDATAQQVREYARLVASLSRSVDDFASENVTDNQVRDWLVERHGSDLALILPNAGERGQPRLAPRQSDTSPQWLERYNLAGQTLTAELADRELVQAARRNLGEERMSHLATMVLMGINRIVVDEGHIKARLQFHAQAREKISANVASQTGAVQAQLGDRQASSAVTTMVSTVNTNAQADIGIKTDLVGEVQIKFRTQAFDLDRFADSNAIQLIQRHARVPEPGTKK